MKKRLIALCLTLALLLGMMPVLSFASDPEIEPAHQAAYAGTVTVDGKLEESAWNAYGEMTDGTSSRFFDVLWDAQNLYIALKPQAADTAFTVSVAGKTLTVSKAAGASGITGATAAWADAVEVKIPVSALEAAVSNYGQRIAMKLSMGDLVWEGDAVLNSTERNAALSASGFSGTHNESTTNLKTQVMADGGFHWSREYAAGVADSQDYASYFQMSGNEILNGGVKGTSVEFDFQMDKVPSDYSLGYMSSAYITYGFALGYMSSKGGSSAVESVSFAITSVGGKMYALIGRGGDAAPVSVDTGKLLKEKFHVQLTAAADGTVNVYIDGALITTVENAVLPSSHIGGTNTSSSLVRLTQYSRHQNRDGCAEDGSKDCSFSLWNFNVSAFNGNSVMDSLTWDTIKGGNISSGEIVKDLALPATLNNAQIPGLELSWESSEPAIIGNDGKVNTSPAEKQITLTATVKNSSPAVTKSFQVTVPAVTISAALLDGTVTLDGALNESIWNEVTAQPFSVVDGISGAQVSGLWTSTTIYLAVKYGTATTVNLQLGDKKWEDVPLTESISNSGLTGSAKNGVAELAIDLAAIGVVLEDYNEVHQLQVSLADGSGNSTAIETAPVRLLLFGLQMSSSQASGYVQGSGSVSASSKDALAYSMTADMGDVIDYTKTVKFSAKLNVTRLDAFEGNTYIESGNVLKPYGLTWFLFRNTGGERGNLYGGTIYNNGTSLIFRGYNGETVDLGVVPGGGVFELSYTRHLDDSADIHVNGEYKGSLSANVQKNIGLNSRKNSVHLRALTPETGKNVVSTWGSVSVVSYGEEQRSLEEDLSKQTILNGITLTDLVNGDTFTLPDSAQTGVGEFDLEWTSENECVVLEKVNGGYKATVTQPDTKVSAYAKLVMTAKRRGGSGEAKVTWNTEASVLGLRKDEIDEVDYLRLPYTAAGITVDGATTDEGWSLDLRVAKNNVVIATVGAQWTTDNLYLAVKKANTTDVLALKVNGKTVDLSSAVTAGQVTELAVSWEDLGITLEDYGLEIPAVIQIGEAIWEGTLVITSNDWFGTDGTEPRLPLNAGDRGTRGTGADAPTKNQGVEDLGNGWRLYDLYDPMGNNPTLVRSYQLYWARENNPSYTQAAVDLYKNFNDRSHPTYTEFDFLAMAMPKYTAGNGSNGATDWSNIFSNYGLTWNVAAGANEFKRSHSVSMGIYNTEEGLVFCAMGEKTTHVVLNKFVGDQFRIGTSWNLDGSLTLYIDGEEYAHIENVETEKNGYGDNSFIVNLIRNKQPAQGSADSFDLYITNISLGKTRGESIFDQITQELIMGENTDPYDITKKLNLPTELQDDQLDASASVQWVSSDPDVIAADGTVTHPEKGGKLVTLTATCNGVSKSYQFYVRGLTYDSNVLVVEGDKDPASGTGVLKDTYFFQLDSGRNSVVLDQEQSKKVSVITLTDGDDENRLNESNLTVWVSDDNATYTKVDSFKLLKQGEKVYLYDFEAAGRYVKVHFTDFDAKGSDFSAPLEQMIQAAYQEVFGAEGAFADSDKVTVKNESTVTLWDDHYTVSAEGISTVKQDKSDVRFFLNGELLYHYYDGKNFVVRVPKIEAKSSVELTVLSGNANAMDISNKEYTLEVVYGTREIREGSAGTEAGRWIESLPDGRLISVQTRTYDNKKCATYAFSYDGGMNWTEDVKIDCTYDYMHYVSGITYIPHNGRIVIQGYTDGVFSGSDMSASNMKTRFAYSDDLGKTWTACPEMAMEGNQATYVLSYSDPLIVSSYDGEGPNVDLVLNAGVQYDNNGSFCCRVAYSCDAGKTWTLGADEIIYTGGVGVGVMEGGISEATIMEKPDEPGTLVLFARCQFTNVDFFAKTYSYDYGKTWETNAGLSEIYTPNTQPILHQFGDAQLMTWGGNNVLGGDSYHRTPMNVAISYDGLETFVNIQDLYTRTSLQNMTTAGRNRITNQSVANVGDTMTLIWDNPGGRRIMRVEDFTNWFYRTKGGYDSFESNSAKSEGWDVITGSVERSDLHAVDGKYSLRMTGGTSVVRSLPYLQNGEVSMSLYLNQGSVATVQLQSAYSIEYGKATPVAFQLRDGKLYFLGSDTGIDIDIIDGWNTFDFKLDLDAETPVAAVYLNGEKVTDAPVNMEAGDYICWLNMEAPSTVLYLDDVQIVDNDVVNMPDECHLGHTPEEDDGDCTTDILCSVCGEVAVEGAAAHTGGEATCEKQAECEVCGTAYGELAKHVLKKVDAVAATTEKEGNKEYYLCQTCKKAFWDAEGKKPIENMDETVIGKLPAGENPDTGDRLEALPLMILMTAAAVSLAALAVSRKKWLA